jgi:hypothetical protein
VERHAPTLPRIASGAARFSTGVRVGRLPLVTRLPIGTQVPFGTQVP